MYIQDSENENNKKFLKTTIKKNRNKNIEFEVKKNDYICIEIPGKIRKGSKGLSAVESLGGLKKITDVFRFHKNNCKYDENLILRINNNDMFSSFISANWTNVNNILIKIKKTRKNKYKFECLGFVKYLYYFDNMSDFYYIPSFYNRYDYNTNYIHYLTKGKKKKQRQKSYNDHFEDNSIKTHESNIYNMNYYKNDSFFCFKNNQIYKSVSQTNKITEDKNVTNDIPFNYDINSKISNNINEIILNNSEINPYIQNNPSTYSNNDLQNKTFIHGNLGIATSNFIHNKNNSNFFSDNRTNSLNDKLINNYNTDVCINIENKDLDNQFNRVSFNDQIDQIEDINQNKQKKSLNDMNLEDKNYGLFNLDKIKENEKDENSEIIKNKEIDDQTHLHMDKWNGTNKYKNNSEYISSINKEYINETLNMHNHQNSNNDLVVNENKMGNSIGFDNTKHHHMHPFDSHFNYYLSDMEENELFNKIINSKVCSEMLDEKKEINFSSDESEAYELHCCIHSKSVTPYDYKNYESIITNKYIRDFKYIISKFTASIDSKAEVKKGEMENFIKELIINNNEKKCTSAFTETMEQVSNNKKNKQVNDDKKNVISNSLYNDIDETNKNMQNKETCGTHEENTFLQKNKMNDSNSTINDPFNEFKNISNSDKHTCSNNSDSLNKYSNKIIVSKKTVHCNPIAKYDDLTLPVIPFDSAIKKYVSDTLYSKVKLLFDIRPIWSKDVLLEHLENISTYCLKSCFSKICFYFVDGPWRRTYCKYGYDPRKDPSSYIYQTIDFRDNFYRNIKTKNLEDINRNVIKKKSSLDSIVTNLIKKINNKHNMITYDNSDHMKNNSFSKIQDEIKNQDNCKRDCHMYSEIPSESIRNDNNAKSCNNFHISMINTISNDLNIDKDKLAQQLNNCDLKDEIFFHDDEEINDILQFLKRSKTFHLRQHFSAEVHFSVTPLKISTIFQFIDIFDNNVLNYLLNVKTQETCSKDYGWLNSKDLAKIRDILFVRSVTLRHAHSK
ncbi:general transcription factor 3C polypeptide 5, putative [Plasmodium relictum]|uniref:General transcription factor 3C polypeptide 5, putative n=1 Tax=Plasmodium relictum TaxID=85471 RepID=A0A1J1H7P5_PLARL|nr:general transcription factor 3C polypeptide 5, putative [Plasmodium relictum]CRH00683.1 general transcription factor 3C polypeptide 5, putative [Plasmodium relictum]